MRVLRWLAIVIFVACGVRGVVHAQEEVTLLAPRSGELLRGQVAIQGHLPTTGFAYAELSFAYAAAPTTWFLIQRLEQPLEGVLAIWDTTLVADGDYHLRLLVVFQDGSQQEARVENLRLRNYVPTPTPTPFPTPVLPRPDAVTFVPPSPTATLWPTPTPLPPNPLSLPAGRLFRAWERGALLAAAFVLILMLGLRKRAA